MRRLLTPPEGPARTPNGGSTAIRGRGDRRNGAEFEFLTTVEHAFNRIWYPGRKPDRSMGLLEQKLELRTAKGGDGRSSAGEARHRVLTKAGKFEPAPEAKADGLIIRIAGNPETNQGGQLWPDGSAFSTIPWSDITIRARKTRSSSGCLRVGWRP